MAAQSKGKEDAEPGGKRTLSHLEREEAVQSGKEKRCLKGRRTLIKPTVRTLSILGGEDCRSEASKMDLRPSLPDLRPPISDLLPNPQIYTRSGTISSDLQPLGLDLVLPLQIWTRSVKISSDLSLLQLDLMQNPQICNIQG